MGRVVALCLCLGGTSVSLQGQSVWLDRSPGTMVALEAMRPRPADGITIGPGWVWFVTTQVPISGTSAFVAELPYVVNDASTAAPNTPRSTIGNPYLGLEFRRREPTSWYDVGVRIPMVDDQSQAAAATGIFTDWDRFDAWTAHVVPLSAHINYQSAGTGAMTIIRVGPTVILPTGDAAGQAAQLLMDYAVMGGYRGPAIDLRGGLTGRMQVTGKNGDLADRFQAAAGISVGWRLGTVEPMIGFRLPIFGDLKDLIEHVVTLSVTVHP